MSFTQTRANPRPLGVWPKVARELCWYFTRRAAGPLKSNFGGMVYRLALGRARAEAPPQDLEDEALEEAARSGAIARVLRALEPETAEVLWRAFGAEWPEELADYGELAALAPLTRTAQAAHRASGTTLDLLPWLGRLPPRFDDLGAMQTVLSVHREALALRQQAVAAYVNMRRKVGPHV
jgi:hypothetical protein